MRIKEEFCLLGLALAGLVAPAAAVGAKAPATPGQLYVNKCAKCHRLYDPAKYSDEKWQMWMGKMSRKAKLSPEQAKSLATYIEEQLRSPKAGSEREHRDGKPKQG